MGTSLIRMGLVSLLLTAASVGVTGQATAATPPVKIYAVRYDSLGSDTGSNTSLNGEYVVLKNMTTTNRVITGWTLRDKQGFVFKFPTFTLKAGATVYVHTGKGTNSATHRYWGRTWYVWNNSYDAAYLRNAAGTLVHACGWTVTGTGSRTC